MGLFNRKSKPGEPVHAQRSAPATSRRSRLVVWYAEDGWRWNLWAANGKLTAESGEAYVRRFDCVEAAKALAGRAANATLEVGDK